jgi:Ca-activated chloride channel homolog
MERAAPALVARVGTDRTRVAPGEHKLHAIVELVAGDAPREAERPALATVLVLDVSGSMRGEPLAQVVRSVERIVDLLGDDDRLGVIAFSTGATEVAPALALDESHRKTVKSRVARLVADDRTNIEAGLLLARSILPARTEGQRRGIVLLSDGEPNVGASTPEELASVARSIRPDAVVSTLGYGLRHDENVLLAIAEGGGSAYRFVQDPAVCQLELAQSVGAQGDVAAEAIEVVLSPEPGVEILDVVGVGKTTYSANGLVIPIADLAANAERSIAVELRVRLDARRLSGKLLAVTVRYRSAGDKSILEQNEVVMIDVADGPPATSAAGCATVLLLRADRARADARALADKGQFEGAATLLRGLMREIEAAPGFADGAGTPLQEAREQLLDEAMAYERKPAAEMLASFKMSTAPKSLSAGDIGASSRAKGATAIRFASATAGLFPEAYLVIADGPRAGSERRLGAQNTIGRTSSADIVVASDLVSRRHADVFALEGEFWIADLGSTNVTSVNDRPLGAKPHRLKAGDRIRVGNVVLIYREVEKR